MPARHLIRLLPLLALGAPAAVAAQGLGTAFTYQGLLSEAGAPVNGLYDVQACLYDSASGIAPLACLPDFDDVPVEAGVFSVALDFGGAAFPGAARFLELRVRPGSSTTGYTVLVPRQPVRPVPETLRAEAASAAPWSGLTGVPAGFADGVDDLGPGTVTRIDTGTGLTGGPITGTGSIAIAPGGVGSAQLAPGAVGTAQLAPGAVGAAQIDPQQVQARIASTCAAGWYPSGVDATGQFQCREVPGTARIADLRPQLGPGDGASIAIGIDGLPIIAAVDNRGPINVVVAKCLDRRCQQPANATAVSTASSFGSGPQRVEIAVPPDGRPLISFVEPLEGRVRLVRCADASCSASAAATVLDIVPAATNLTHSMALGANGLASVVHANALAAGELRFVRCNDADCSLPSQPRVLDGPLLGGTGASLPSMVLDSTQRPLVAYIPVTFDRLLFVRCDEADCSTQPTRVTLAQQAAAQYVSARIAIGGDGLPIVAYRLRGNGSTQLRVLRCGDLACTAIASDIALGSQSDNGVNTNVDLAIGSDGLPVIAHKTQAGQSELEIVKCTSSGCTGSIALVRFRDVSSALNTVDIAIGADGLPIIVSALVLTPYLVSCGTPSCRS